MQLLVVTPWPLLTPGGGQRLATEIATTLAVDHQVDLLVAAGSGLSTDVPGPRCAPPVREVRLPLVQRSAPGWRLPRGGALATAVLEGLDALAEHIRPEAILFTPHCSACGHQALALAARLNVRFLLWPAIHLDARSHTDRAAQRFYRSAAMVFCLSDIERQWLVRCAGVSPQRALTLGYGWSGEMAPCPRRVSMTSELRLLTVGAYVPHKQLDHQLEALALLRNVFGLNAHLTVAGVLREPAVLDRLRDLVAATIWNAVASSRPCARTQTSLGSTRVPTTFCSQAARRASALRFSKLSRVLRCPSSIRTRSIGG